MKRTRKLKAQMLSLSTDKVTTLLLYQRYPLQVAKPKFRSLSKQKRDQLLYRHQELMLQLGMPMTWISITSIAMIVLHFLQTAHLMSSINLFLCRVEVCAVRLLVKDVVYRICTPSYFKSRRSIHMNVYNLEYILY